jgi:hypothetical protein
VPSHRNGAPRPVLAGVAAFAMVVLSSCSVRLADGETPVSVQVYPSVEEPSAEQLCALVPLDVVNETVPVPFAEAEPGVGAIAECRYQTAFDPNAGTRGPAITLLADLRSGEPEPTALDDEFRDENDRVVDYQRLTGLGDSAGYGPYTRAPGSGSTYLVVLQGIENGYWEVSLEVQRPDAGGITVEALRAFTERVLEALPS